MSSGYIRGASATSRSSSIPPGAVVHNAKASRVYVFGNTDVFEDEVNGEPEVEMSEIRSRRSNASRSPTRKSEEPMFFEREITEGDTLSSIALQYSCPVAELKRINNLIRDQEFYGRRMIKVPIKRHGYLSEILELEKENERKRADQRLARASIERVGSEEGPHDTDSTADFSDPETQRKIIHHLSIRDHMSQQGRETQKFLDSMDKDLARIRNSTRSDRNSLSEVISVLTQKNFQPLQKPSHMNGADCGMTWWKVLLAFAVVVIVGIAVVLIYFYQHKEDS